MTGQEGRHSLELVERAREFRNVLQSVKRQHAVPDYGWYPYDSLAGIDILDRLIGQGAAEAGEALTTGPVADIGCGDGDLAAFCASLGAQVDAIDHLESNFNQMRGSQVLREALALSVSVHDIDLDRPFQLPRSDYRFAFFLGTLYHLKNPYYVLEHVAGHADWCFLSTRIARLTPRQTPIEDEPVAYLLDPREANNDPTNYWIFSATGLMRLLRRAGWAPVGHERAGHPASDPVRHDRDERIFVLMKSRVRHPGLLVKPAYGWYALESGGWRWTAKKFGIEVLPAQDEPVAEFALRFVVPEAIAAAGTVRLTCAMGGEAAGAITCAGPEEVEFRGRFPRASSDAMLLEFAVESGYRGSAEDQRELGVIVPGEAIPFRVS